MRTAIGTSTVETSFGLCSVAWTKDGVVATTLPRGEAASAGENLALQLKYAGIAGGGPRLDKTEPAIAMERFLVDYFRGIDRLPLVTLDLTHTTAWQRAACHQLLSIPRGGVRNYAWLAAQLGKPLAARAAGLACRRNPIPVYIPCHRVVGSDGSLTGFGGGLEMKRKMLDMERE
jgi:methylated-DNA-[protein]-cysteine S-methyltransferase